MADFAITKTRVVSKYAPDSGVKCVLVTATGPNPAASGGAVLNLARVQGSVVNADLFAGEVLSIVGSALGAAEYSAQYVPHAGVTKTSYANQPSLAKVALFDDSGQKTSGDLSKVTFQFLVVGTDKPVPTPPAA